MIRLMFAVLCVVSFFGTFAGLQFAICLVTTPRVTMKTVREWLHHRRLVWQMGCTGEPGTKYRPMATLQNGEEKHLLAHNRKAWLFTDGTHCNSWEIAAIFDVSDWGT